jgi:hypothetical protein
MSPSAACNPAVPEKVMIAGAGSDHARAGGKTPPGFQRHIPAVADGEGGTGADGEVAAGLKLQEAAGPVGKVPSGASSDGNVARGLK